MTSIGPRAVKSGRWRSIRTIQGRYAATAHYSGAFKSTNGSDRWVKSGVPNMPLDFNPRDPDTIYAIDLWNGGPDGFLKSTDWRHKLEPGKVWATLFSPGSCPGD